MKNNLPELRAANRWSQGVLAEKLGVSRQTVNAIETEKYDPSLPLAFRVARLFNLAIEEIFDGGMSPQPSKNQDVSRQQLKAEVRSLVATSEDLSWD